MTNKLSVITKVSCHTALVLALFGPAVAVTSAVAAHPSQAKQLSSSDQAALRIAKQHFINQDFELAFQSLLPLAVKGDADAQYGVGYLLYYGKGIAQDKETGVDWIQKSAAQGFANAQKALELLNLLPKKAKQAAQEVPAKPQKIAQAEKAPLSQKSEINHEGYSMQELLGEQKHSIKSERYDPEIIDSIQANDISSYKSKANAIAANTKLITAKQPETAAAVQNLMEAINSDRSDVAAKPIQKPTSIATYGPTSPTDTLWSIAKATRPNKSVSLQQMMMAIMADNPQAFTKNNINALKKGSILKIPSTERAGQFDPKRTLVQLMKQDNQWDK